MDAEMHQALTERRDLIEQRATTLLDGALTDGEPWTHQLGARPAEPRKQAAWLRAARTVVAYRDRYQITDNHDALGPTPADHNVKLKIDAARARAALAQARGITDSPEVAVEQRPVVVAQRGLGLQ
jgi:hypothetical protein